MTEIVHERVVNAAADDLFDVVANVTEAARYFPTHLHAEVLAEQGGTDLVERWVLDNGVVRNWRMRRTLDRAAGWIAFEHETPSTPMPTMSGRWEFEPLGPALTRVRARYRFALDTADPAADAARVAAFDSLTSIQLAQTTQIAGRLLTLRRGTITGGDKFTSPAPLDDVSERLVLAVPRDPEEWLRVSPYREKIVLKRRRHLRESVLAEIDEIGLAAVDGRTIVTVQHAAVCTSAIAAARVRTSWREFDEELRAGEIRVPVTARV